MAVYLLLFVEIVFWLFSGEAISIVLDVDDTQSILEAASLTARNVQALYNGNQTGGVLGKWPYPPYFWWESGGAWGGMVEYWHYTGDQSYVNVTTQALLSQLGPGNDFNVPAEAFDTGNDDQAFWVFAAMSAAEYSFPEPPAPFPPWFAIAVNAWQDYVSRWNSSGCNGGLKWQFHPENAGYYYKNSISNGGFFQLSARLARFTGNDTYVHWAETVWNWVWGIGLIDNIYNVYDGTDELINCTGVDHHQWTYNVGVFLYGAAMLQNYTNGSSTWTTRTEGLLDATATFISPFRNATDVLFEAACELDNSCNVDQKSMKAYLIRWMAATSLMVPSTAGRIGEVIRASAMGAAAACSGGANNDTCGSKWYLNGWDGTTGLGQELSALEAIYALLVNQTNPPARYPNVVIATATSSARNTPTATSQPGPASGNETPRPLHDSKGSSGGLTFQNKARTVFTAILSTLIMM